jgi:ATP-dependent Clp protease ATP-binding subunit ClpA
VIELKRQLVAKLEQMHVRIKVRDGDTVVFRGLPVNPRFFSKPRTNLLVQRAREGMPFLVCVDEDMEYTGSDSALASLFAGGVTREGWRVLYLGNVSQDDPQEAVESALTALGFDGQEPALPPPPSQAATASKEPGLLASLGTDLSRQVLDGNAEPTIGRAEEVEEVISCVLRWGQARLPVVVAETGCGKTNLLHGIAHRLSECRPEFTLMSIHLGQLLAGTLFDAERENLLARLLTEAAASTQVVVAIEHIELALLEAPHGRLLLAKSLDDGVRLIGTTLPEHLSQFEAPLLARRLQIVELGETTPNETVAILAASRERVAAHHGVEIDDSCLHACVKAACALPGQFPAKALALLDAAASKAALSGATVVGPDDIYHVAAGQPS